jgi:tetratricopeptide (TPR) repeat protein
MSASILDAERAHSLNFRFQCENQLIARALQQPIFGWGGWGRNTAYLARNEEGSFAFQAATDGLWVITLGINGYVGLTLLYTVILLPVILMIRRFPVSTWNTPAVAPAVACGTILALYLIDCLLNGFVNLIYIVMCGGLISTMPAPSIAGRAKPRDQDEKESIKAIEAGDSPTLERMATAAARLRRAESYIQVARSLSAEGQPEAAVAARRHALDLLREAWVLNPEDMAIRRRWCDCANDLAWSLANHADPRSRNPDEAVDLARRTVAALPSEGTYWNTLGAAQVRAGDYRDAVGSIERSIELCGGTGFDYGFLAMANAKLGDRDQAEHWLAQALEWTAAERPGHGELTRLCEEARGILASAPASPAITS